MGDTQTLEKKIAFREHLVTDMGNGGSYCSHCDYNLGPNPLIDYKECPGCGYTLIPGGIHINQGGSDF